MRILFVTTELPWPVNSGGRMRVSKTIEGLERNNELVFAVADKKPPALPSLRADGIARDVRLLTSTSRKPIGLLGQMTWGRYRPVFGPSTYYRFRRSFLELVDKVKPDLIWYTHLYTPWRCGFPDESIPIVLDMDNIESQKYCRDADTASIIKKLMIKMDLSRFCETQKNIAQQCNIVLLASEDHTGVLGNANIRVVPNGFDFSMPPSFEIPTSMRLVFIGWLEYQPNADGIEWFCRKVFPIIKRRLPDVEIDIIGRYSPHLEQLKRIIGVNLHGFVDDADPILRNASAMVVPLRIGGGTRIKILEAWSKGLPVISTGVGCEGLNAQEGKQLLIADEPEDFAGKCVKLISDRDLAFRIAKEAYEYGLARYDWSSVYAVLESVMHEAKSLT